LAIHHIDPDRSRTSLQNIGFCLNSNTADVTLVVWWLVCLPLDPKVAGSNPAKAMDFFKGDKNPQYTFLSDGK
jgi:hypothetical protein